MSKDFKVKNGLQVSSHITASGNISSSATGSFGKMTIGTSTMAHANTQLTIVGGLSGVDMARFTRDTSHGASAEPFVSINANSADPQIRFYEGTDQAAIGQDATNSNLVFATGSHIKDKEAMVIDTDGKVGIGTTSPSAKLDVTGDLRVSTHITASGNISASGGGTHIFGGPIRLINPADNTATQRIEFGNDTQRIEGKDDFLVFESDNQAVIKSDVKVNIDSPIMGVGAFTTGDTAGAVLHISGVNATNESLIVEGSDGTDYLTVGLGGHITASGNISSSGTSTGSFGHIQIPDNGHIVLGADPDLQIYHDGNNSYIEDSGTGQLRLIANQVIIKNAADNENIIRGSQNGSVELFHDNSLKLETTTAGIQVLGNISSSSHITASGNISSSGTITGNAINVNGTDVMTGFVLEDGDGTEVDITNGKEVKFVEAGGININWSDTSDGTDGDPYDLSFNVYTSQTSINSLRHNSLIIGGNSQNNTIDFGTDDTILFDIDNTEVAKIEAGGLDVTGHITASGNISSSGTIKAHTLNVQGNSAVGYHAGSNTLLFSSTGLNTGIKGDAISFTSTEGFAPIHGVSHITSSGNISASGTITATSFAGNLTGDVTGKADSADTLETARNIGGVSFNGSANINLPGVNTGGNQDTSGNAATATALETARNIGGVSFDGTGNINLPGVNTGGNQDTSGTAAVATTVTITDNENTNEENAIIFTAGGDLDGGNIGLESDGDLRYNPSTGKITTTQLSASGAIQSNELTASAFQFVGSGTAELEVQGHITASGNISASGATHTFGGTTTVTHISASSNSFIHLNKFDRTVNPASETYSSAGQGMGDVVYFGTGTLSTGLVYYLNSSLAWTALNATDDSAGADELLGVALGSDPSSDGVLLRGIVRLAGSPGSTNGAAVYASTSAGNLTQTAPNSSGNIIRVCGYLTNGSIKQMWFNPSSTWVEKS